MYTNMTQKGLWRAITYSSICLTALLLVIFTPNITDALSVTNNAPIITSNPTLVVTTDQTYQYTITATDIDNDAVSFRLTNSPDGFTLDGDSMSWQPNKVGIYNVVVEVTDQNNGYDNQAWQITVEAGEATSIVVTPNNKPTNINLGSSQQFTAIAYDADGNIITDAEFKWLSDNQFTSVDTNGLVTTKNPGIGFVTASIGNIESTPGILVHDNEINLLAETTEEPVEEVTETVDEEEVVAEDLPNTEETNDEESSSENSEEAELMTLESNDDENNDEEEEDEPCINIAHGLTFTLLIIYAIVLAIYFMYEKKHKSTSWWVFPLLVTFIGLIIYYRYFCEQTYLWWPWILVVIGILTTGYYKGRTSTPTEDNPGNELPF